MVAVLMPEMVSVSGAWLTLGAMGLLVALASLVRVERPALVAIALVALVLIVGVVAAEAILIPCQPPPCPWWRGSWCC